MASQPWDPRRQDAPPPQASLPPPPPPLPVSLPLPPAPVQPTSPGSLDDFELIEEVEWAEDKDAGGELAVRPKYDRSTDPCGCKPEGDGRTCCTDMSCVLHACQEECRNNCEAGAYCGNKRITKKEWKKVEIFNAGVKGRGLRALEDIKKGDLIIEYVGRAIRKGYLDRLFQRYRKERMLYIMALDSNTYIDARKKGGMARFINHSCEPNCIVERWKVRGILRAGVFSLKDIKAGEELSFDYQWDRKRGRAPTKCHCQSPTCRGTLEKSMEEDELERRLKGHWKTPSSKMAGKEIVNRSIKILSQEHHEYFTADVCKYDAKTGQHWVIYRHSLEEVMEDLSKEKWMILDEEAEQFVISKKSTNKTSSLLAAGLAEAGAAPVKNYMFLQTPVKDQLIGRHLIERCQRNCHVTIDIVQCVGSFETPLPDDKVGLEQQRALEASRDNTVWKLTISGFNTAKAFTILEKNAEFIEKSLYASEAAAGLAPSAIQTVSQEIIIPRSIVDHVKRRLPELRDKEKNVNVTFAPSESKSKQFSRLMLEATLASDLEAAKNHAWNKLVQICREENVPMAPSGIYKDLGFLGGELRSDQFRLLLDQEKDRLNQECTEDLSKSPFFASFESTQRCTVWVQSEEDKGRIDANNRIVSEAVPNAPRKVYFGCEPKDVPKVWNLVQVRAGELARGVRYLHLGADSMYQKFMMRNGCQFFDYIRKITAVSVTIDSMTGNHLRIDGRTPEVLTLEDLPTSESSRVAIAEELIHLQIELYRDHYIRQQNWIFGRDWTLMNSPALTAPKEVVSTPGKNASRHSTPSSRNQFEPRAIATACMETAEIVSCLELSGSVAAHAVIIMYRFLNVIAADQETPTTNMKTRELLLGSLFLANKAQKVNKWKRMDALLEAAYKVFYPGASFDRKNEEVAIMEKRVMSAEAEILDVLDYDIFWRSVDWILTAAIEGGKVSEPIARNVFDLSLSGPVLAAGPSLWLKYGAEYVFAAVAGFVGVLDLERLFAALSLIPLKVSQAADIIANSIKSSPGNRKGSTHTFFSQGKDALIKQVPSIRATCIQCMSKGLLGGSSTAVASDSSKMHEIIARRDNRQRVFRGVSSLLVREKIVPIIDGLCAESNCKVFVGENTGGGTEDIILQGSWRALAIAEHLIAAVCHSPLPGYSNVGMPGVVPSLPPPVDGHADRDESSSMQAKLYPGLMSTSAVEAHDGWEGTIQSAVLSETPSWGRKVGGKCCVAAKISEDSVRRCGLRWWIPPRYGPSPSGAICDMFSIRNNGALPNNPSDDLGALASLARDLMGHKSSEVFPALMAFHKNPSNGGNESGDRYVAVSLQRWPSEKVANREKRSKGSLIGFSAAALQELELLTQLHALIPSPQGHPNFILPIAITLPPEEPKESLEQTESVASNVGKARDDDIFSLFRTSEENEKVAQKEKKKRNNLVTGAHLVFHPTPFIMQKFTSRSKRSSDKNDQTLTPPILTAWLHDLLSALVHCHENHVVLRALQADQIVIDHSGVAKLGGLYRGTVLPPDERRKSPNPLKSARSRKDKHDESDETSSSYLAPEILLGSMKHTKEADVWSMGCLFAHLLLNKSLFVGKDRASLLQAVFKIVGTPSKDNYAHAAKFPFYVEPPKRYKRGVQRALRHMLGDTEAEKHALTLDLLERMLHLDPRKRITAAEALKHESMVDYVEKCNSDAFRRQYATDWLALKQKLMKAKQSVDDDPQQRGQKGVKRKAEFMAASSQGKDAGDDDILDMDDLLGEM